MAKITGPMSPLLFAQEMAREGGFKFNRLARIWLDDAMIFQQIEYGEQTGYDTLIIATVYANDLWISLWVDMGVKGLPVAMAHKSDREITITPVYDTVDFERKLTDTEIDELFTPLFDNPSLLGED